MLAGTGAWKAAVPSLRRGSQLDAGPRTEYIQLRGLPKTAVPLDIIRLLIRNLVDHTHGVALEYNKFRPTGRAYVRFLSPDIVSKAVRRINLATMTSLPLTATPVPSVEFTTRIRGAKGLEEAAERGIITGDGANAGLPISSMGVSVVVTGLPLAMGVDQVRAYFEGFEFAPNSVRTGVVLPK
ncbi:hypothetical protein OE88DRAFT_1805361 [Heliocybe sulcata]|uniref:RRM domain-containing protein n=1 Tax=Heliocybe sulcata TaxID=5364 RepID=A0A5C3NCB9_9AGAM|nr:hypothetical protein OE88DRAFT_1805361 [Heliocybe sulcata]